MNEAPGSTESYQQRRRLERLDRDALAQHQLDRLNALLARVLPDNRFYAEKFAGATLPLRALDDLAQLPLTTKDELLPAESAADLPANAARNHTYAVEHYTRFHQTSGTRGRPLVVLDTPEDWQGWIHTWQFVLDAAELGPADRVLLAFSFGPFIGFWTAFDAATARGCLVIPGGGMSSEARLGLLDSASATAVFCTPSYALHLAEKARSAGIDLAATAVRALVVAGEPGGSVPALRDRIEEAWGAKVIDHSGATEVGPWGYADAQRRGLHVVESEFIAEFLALDGDRPAGEGELSEIVLTNLGRAGAPLVRYRTGDLVRPSWHHGGENRFVLLPGGVLGRRDDMMIIRGVNVYPTAVEEILRGFPEVAEFRLTATRRGALDELSIEVEDAKDEPQRIARELQLRLGLRVQVRAVPAGALPRFEAKGKRFVDQRGK